MLTLLENANVLDVQAGEIRPDCSILIEGSKIREIGHRPAGGPNARRIDLRGLTVMPGLIDCHTHVMQSTTNIAAISRESPFYAAARAYEIMQGMLMRGFTTVRDVGGADFGLAKVVEEGRVAGPRIIFGGKALTATGGHGDYRAAGQYSDEQSYWVPKLSRLCDGVTELRRAVRDEVRKGAHHIKIMANGGIASPTDRVTSDQYSEEEIRAVVDEAEMAGLYVCAHLMTARAICRAVRCGVRSVEHGNLADTETLELIKSSDAFLVPTLIVFRALAEDGVADGLAADLASKISDSLDRGMAVVEQAHRLGVQMAFGSDLIGGLHKRQSEEFALRASLVPAADLIRSATINGARLIRREHELGLIAEGYEADLIAIDGNPLDDIKLLAEPARTVKLIMQGGRVVKHETVH